LSRAKFALLAAAFSCLIATSLPALAETVSAEIDRSEIIVTAQRRPERPDDVPISLTALSSTELERMQATNTPSLGKVVPSLVMMRTGAFTLPYLRGVGKRSTLGVENGVATYLDGVYLASSISALLDLRGIERVEVLNGPQGTLFGRNATGGVIQVVTRDPSPEAAGEATLHAGNYDYLRGDLYLTGGNDRISGNLAMSLSRVSGFGTNLYSGAKDQSEIPHSVAARSKLALQPTETLKLTLAADYQDIAQDYSTIPVEGYPPIGQPRVQHFRDRDQNLPNRYRFRYGGVSLKADADIGTLAFMSLTAARRMDARYDVDLDQGPLQLFSAVVAADQRQISQEVQLQSADGSMLRWVAGLYFIRIDERYDPTTFSYGGSYSARLGGRTSQTLFSHGIASSYAAYGQATAPIDEKTELTLGLRYTIEHRTVEARGQQTFETAPFIRPISGLPLIPQTPFRNELTFREPTWRTSIQRRFSDALMGYLSASRGFQSGGWNLQTPQVAPFGPETLDDYEIGVKFTDRDQRLRVSANAFLYDYADVQVSAITSLGNVTTNATSARTYGAELQLDARLDDYTDITGGLAWLRARYDAFPNASCNSYDATAAIPYAPRACDVTGNHLPFAPSFKLNLGANRKIPLGGAGTVLLSGNLAYNSGFYSEPDNVVKQDAYATIDLSAEWRPRAGTLSVRLWVINLTDSRYYLNLVTFATAGVFYNPSAPRRFGASFSHAF